MSRFKQIKLAALLPFLFASVFGGAVVATVPTQSAQAACNDTFITFPAWYKGLTTSGCELKKISEQKGSTASTETLDRYIWIIVLNVLEILLQVVGYAAIIMIIYAGFMYMASSGNPQVMADALKTIINASVGLVIALSVIAIKDFVWELMTGGTNDFGVYKVDPSVLLTSGLDKAYFIAGAVAVLVIVVSGIRFITSAGGSDGVARSKRMILGAVAGLVVVIAASAITKFVIGYFN